MKRHVLITGLIGGILLTLLQWSQYKFLVIDHSVELYAAMVAAIFSALGIWLGRRLTAPQPPSSEVSVPAPASIVPAPDLAYRAPDAALRTPDSLLAAQPALASAPFVPNQSKRDDLGITRRELEILELVAQGMSNREIAGKLFVSENTVKTHCSRTFDKLGAKRRTQAVQLGKEFGLLP